MAALERFPTSSLKTNQRNSRLIHSFPSAVSEEEAAFMGSLQRFHTGRGSPLQLPVRLKQRDANLFLMWRQVMACGGFEPVGFMSNVSLSPSGAFSVQDI